MFYRQRNLAGMQLHVANEILLHDPADTAEENMEEIKQNAQPLAIPAQNASISTIVHSFVVRLFARSLARSSVRSFFHSFICFFFKSYRIYPYLPSPGEGNGFFPFKI